MPQLREAHPCGCYFEKIIEPDGVEKFEKACKKAMCSLSPSRMRGMENKRRPEDEPDPARRNKPDC